MTFTTTITPAEIAIAADKAAPSSGSTQYQRWEMWIGDALRMINKRAAKLNVTTLAQEDIDYVVREAVADHVKRPDDATQVTVSVDDGASTRTYKSGKGRVVILDEWWTDLGLSTPDGAFSIDLLPAGYTLGGA
jgi:hypothetical protein